MFNYICEQKTKHNIMPSNPVLVKTIVTTDLADKIANKYEIKTINVLTGFKFIGEQIGLLEKQNRLNDFVFSFEESDGYLSGTYVRDKDGVNGACLVCEMYAYYKTRNITLQDKLEEIYKEFGYYSTSLQSYEFPGSNGFEKMQSIMKSLRENSLQEIAGHKVIKQLDYLQGIDNLPKSDVIKYFFENGSLVIRPSGTEPKLKIYIISKNTVKINDTIINSLLTNFHNES